MRLERGAEPSGSQQAVWAGETSRADVQCLGVWTEKRAGLGEDAEPTLLLRQSGNAGVLGVYDGMGGAGARLLGHTPDGRPVSHAFAASRLAHLTVQEHFTGGYHRQPSLEARLREVFDAARPPGGLKLRGTITKQLPTTLAVIDYSRPHKSGPRYAAARWAGDSRCYLLTPEWGLQQISRDDSIVDDPLETLMADQPLTNQVAAGLPFRIREEPMGPLPEPCVLLCATDGFFGYVPSPAIFEFELLRALGPAADAGDWGRKLAAWRRRTAGDDATLALVAIGFGGFRGLRSAFKHRFDQLYYEHAEPLRDLENAELDDAERRHRLAEYRHLSWTKYSGMYVARMAGRAS
ncbi:hypothetical protein GCM10010168_45850 [Actinoplanes ianthinogenes]|uniref:Serine/threonine protein phosphatase PrpC n=1 Tax=Actinoplanes ianthinogenes TaxID=122358 RepID=A0ABM7LPB0_9ACTN|nr:serine/threonine protein phosphatase [Actinoplanes ianthinogenes]BCJ41117.1 hypothetical protein Aiant_17740 [Actinoplanes ianthinogenes]GGR22801.1 hypothetical protein GCM10010168_45850 [Actinoplanes ianthinogenes]